MGAKDVAVNTCKRWKEELISAFAEFTAALLLVFMGPGAVSAYSLAYRTANGSTFVDPVAYALSFGLVITALAWSIGSISGAHINPSITLAMFVSRNLTLTRTIFYMTAQFGGACCGGGILRLAVGTDNYNSGITLADNINANGGLILEMMGTILLIFVVFSTAHWAAKPDHNNLSGTIIGSLAPIPIGFAVAVAHLVLGPFTGCGINPARVIGAVIWDTKFWDTRTGQGGNFWIYIVGPFVASCVVPIWYFLMYGTVKAGAAERPWKTDDGDSDDESPGPRAMEPEADEEAPSGVLPTEPDSASADA